MTEETLGSRIAAHRKRLGLTQDALAERLGLTAQAVSKWENDQSCPDIAMLPRLAAIFDTTTDELLGVERKQEEVPVQVPEEAPAEIPAEAVGRRLGVGIALWLLLTGAVLLAPKILPAPLFEIPFWWALAMAGLTVFGLMGILPRFSIFRLGCGLLGAYYLHCALLRPAVQLNEELLLPLLLIFFGLGLLLDTIRGRKLPAGHRDWKEITQNRFDCQEDTFACQTCFGEAHRLIQLPRLKGGNAEVVFGELSVDIHDCGNIADDCGIRLKCCFGDLTLYVPRQRRVQCANRTAFGTVQEYGSADVNAQGVIRVECNVSFGEISIKYI